eukprot:406556_1
MPSTFTETNTSHTQKTFINCSLIRTNKPKSRHLALMLLALMVLQQTFDLDRDIPTQMDHLLFVSLYDVKAMRSISSSQRIFACSTNVLSRSSRLHTETFSPLTAQDISPTAAAFVSPICF